MNRDVWNNDITMDYDTNEHYNNHRLAAIDDDSNTPERPELAGQKSSSHFSSTFQGHGTSLSPFTNLEDDPFASLPSHEDHDSSSEDCKMPARDFTHESQGRRGTKKHSLTEDPYYDYSTRLFSGDTASGPHDHETFPEDVRSRSRSSAFSPNIDLPPLNHPVSCLRSDSFGGGSIGHAPGYYPTPQLHAMTPVAAAYEASTETVGLHLGVQADAHRTPHVYRIGPAADELGAIASIEPTVTTDQSKENRRSSSDSNPSSGEKTSTINRKKPGGKSAEALAAAKKKAATIKRRPNTRKKTRKKAPPPIKTGSTGSNFVQAQLPYASGPPIASYSLPNQTRSGESTSQLRCSPTAQELYEAKTPRAREALDTWYSRLQELIKYKIQHGDCNVPQKYPPNPQLGVWVNKQRMEKKFLDENQKSSITPYKLQALEQIGFVWAKRKGQPSWDARFAELKAYLEKHGDCNVPTKYNANPALGRWVSTQRSQYKQFQLLSETEKQGFGNSSKRKKRSKIKGKKRKSSSDSEDSVPSRRKPGSGNIQITQERIDKLEAIGFRWNMMEEVAVAKRHQPTRSGRRPRTSYESHSSRSSHESSGTSGIDESSPDVVKSV